MQHYVIVCDEPWGLGLHEKLMPEFFQVAGYKTHMIGKWHLGFHEKEYTPTFRGFDEHVGFLGAYVDYFDHTLIDSVRAFKYTDLFYSIHRTSCSRMENMLVAMTCEET
jgi:arylsulfatase A-like enzyme